MAAAAAITRRGHWKAFAALACAAVVLLGIAVAATGRRPVSVVPLPMTELLSKAVLDAGQAVLDAGERLIVTSQAAALAMLNLAGPDVPLVPMAAVMPVFETQQMVKRASRRLNSKTARAMLTLSHFRFRQHLLHNAREHPWC